MGYYAYRHFTTFDEIRNWYERTKPVVSALHTREDDIRPIGKRSRKWERIAKIDNNCYALLSWGFDGIRYYHSRNVEGRTSLKDLKRLAPIVWERNPKTGEEFVTVHNYRSGYATSLYEFFRKYLPGRLSMPNRRDGRQFVTDGTNAYYLPYNEYTPANFGNLYRQDDEKKRKARMRPCAERKLVFKRNGTDFVLVSEPYVLERKASTVVLKEEKDAFRNEIREFKRFVMVTAPVLAGTVTRAEMHAVLGELVSAATGEKIPFIYGRWWQRYDADVMRLALTNPDSPLRVALVYAFIDYSRSCDWYVSSDREDSLDLVKSRLNNFVNLAFRFTKPNK